jgi:hypothetical protein
MIKCLLILTLLAPVMTFAVPSQNALVCETQPTHYSLGFNFRGELNKAGTFSAESLYRIKTKNKDQNKVQHLNPTPFAQIKYTVVKDSEGLMYISSFDAILENAGTISISEPDENLQTTFESTNPFLKTDEDSSFADCKVFINGRQRPGLSGSN